MDQETKERMKNTALYHQPLTNEEMGIKPGQEWKCLHISLALSTLLIGAMCLLKYWGWM